MDMYTVRAAYQSVELFTSVANRSLEDGRFCQTDRMIDWMIGEQNLSAGSMLIKDSGIVLMDMDIFAYSNRSRQMKVSHANTSKHLEHCSEVSSVPTLEPKQRQGIILLNCLHITQ